MATMEGGVIGTDDEELYDILLSIRSHGWTRHLPKENKLCVKSDNNFEESWRFILPGYNVRPVEMMGAIGVEQLKNFPNSFVIAVKTPNILKNCSAATIGSSCSAKSACPAGSVFRF